jgi:recombination protein RecA
MPVQSKEVAMGKDMSAKKVDKKTSPLIRKLSDIDEVQFVSSGMPEVDELTGGFPKSRLTEVYGKTGVGKTSLMAKTLAAMSARDKVLFIDSENALNKDRVAELGGDITKIDFSTEYILEDVADLVMDSLDKYDIIVVDSIAGLTPKTELEGESGAANVGVKAKRVHQWMRKMTGKLGKSKCALVFINQLHESPNMYQPTYTTGGTAIPYASSLRLELSNNKSDRVGSPGAYTGVWVHVTVTKSKVSKPYLTTKFKLEF